MEINGNNIAGLIIAGGAGTRMGGTDKCLLTLGAKPLLHYTHQRLAPQVASVALNVNGALDRFNRALADLPPIPMLPDTPPSAGPLSGIIAGLTWLQSHPQQWLLTVAADTPFFPADLGRRLAKGLGVKSHLAVASEQGRMHPLFGLWHKSLLPRLTHAYREDQHKLQQLVRELGGIQVDFGSCQPAFFNINTREELAEARALMN
ncbi:molybdenum cofactor guanylyltransferase [Simiduia sp. 21SJ11W-1]|uniref:molybdenum cofactor guanylyltransferase MobA n=1 Tax=Simiduia sp. 21SJ11W-1 TaxID=2909669 RepID=UPI00209EEA5A|nr:molybdenum cofactor guanylyltransferase MobA [Simiduia sp. 21SJ11W-1]UTA48939.1 molybdenum cofactor guanylyltransferase [Simiduia sp. 21SJ11W-1]